MKRYHFIISALWVLVSLGALLASILYALFFEK